jgi:hypothetical protein
MTIYAVVKKTKDGSLKTEKKKNEVFIAYDENEKVEEISLSKPEEKIGDFEKAYFKLKLKHLQLQKKYDALMLKTAPR